MVTSQSQRLGELPPSVTARATSFLLHRTRQSPRSLQTYCWMVSALDQVCAYRPHTIQNQLYLSPHQEKVKYGGPWALAAWERDKSRTVPEIGPNHPRVDEISKTLAWGDEVRTELTFLRPKGCKQ
jgi:hypothetical protein